MLSLPPPLGIARAGFGGEVRERRAPMAWGWIALRLAVAVLAAALELVGTAFRSG